MSETILRITSDKIPQDELVGFLELALDDAESFQKAMEAKSPETKAMQAETLEKLKSIEFEEAPKFVKGQQLYWNDPDNALCSKKVVYMDDDGEDEDAVRVSDLYNNVFSVYPAELEAIE